MSKKYYIFLFLVYSFFTIFLAGFTLDWAAAGGYNIAALVVSFFIVRATASSKRAIVGVVLTLVTFLYLNVMEGMRGYEKQKSLLSASCVEEYAVAAIFGSEEDALQYCSCASENLTLFAMSQDAKIFFGLTSKSEIDQSSYAREFIIDVSMQCFYAD